MPERFLKIGSSICDWKDKLATAPNLSFQSHDALILPSLSLFLSGSASLDGRYYSLAALGERFRSAFSALPAKILPSEFGPFALRIYMT
jgi:hypothetical protein